MVRRPIEQKMPDTTELVPPVEVEALADEQDGLLPKEECLARARDILRGRVPG